MKINITQKDIDNGMACDEYKCPIALAIKRAFNKGVDTNEVSVSYEDGQELIIRVGTDYHHQSDIDKHEHIGNFISWFDNGLLDSATPFTFNLS